MEQYYYSRTEMFVLRGHAGWGEGWDSNFYSIFIGECWKVFLTSSAPVCVAK